MAVMAFIPRAIMVDKKLNNMARLVYAYYSMMVRTHSPERISKQDALRFMPFGSRQIEHYSKELAIRRYITFEEYEDCYEVSIPEEIYVSIDTSVDKSKRFNTVRVHKDTNYVASTIVELYSHHMTEQFGKEYRPKVTDKVKEKVNARLKTFTSQEIITACENRMNHLKVDKWWNKPENLKFKKDIFNLIKSDDKLDTWLNLEVKDEGETGLQAIKID